jgi:hypothetical protein
MKKETIIHYSFKFIICILLILTSLCVCGHSNHENLSENCNVSLYESNLAAKNFLMLKDKYTDYSIHQCESFCNMDSSVHLGYIYHLQPTGYIIITSSKLIQPVFAYSFTSPFLVNNQQNPLQYLLTNHISHQIEKSHLIPSNEKQLYISKWDRILTNPYNVEILNDFQQWPPAGSTNTEGWIETQWNQFPPYNNFCPIDITDGGKRSVAGCPSIAMGQILNYHHTINQVQFDDRDDYYHKYLSSFWIDNDHIAYDFPSFPTLNNYLKTVEDHYKNNTPLTEDDLAAITFACGIAAEQVYSSSVSGTYGVDQAYEAYQRFGCNTSTLYYRPDDTVYDKIIENIKQALPIHYAVVTPAWDAGHNLIIDGYNTDGYFHLNFGWGGSYDGWYFIPENLPYQLTVNEGVIVDILNKTTLEDLSVDGSIIWQEKTGGEIVEGNFIVENVGEQNSLLTWEIASTPEWGDWTINPSSGHSIRPIDGNITVHVSCILPDEQGKEYNDSITIINSNNPSDRGYIPISLSLPKNNPHTSLFWQIIKYMFSSIETILNLF